MTKRLIYALLFALTLTMAVSAQWAYLGFEQITVAGTSVGFTATTLRPNGANTSPQATVGACRVTTAQIRYRIDGTAPTSTVGIVAEIGDVIALNGPDVLQKFRAIRTTSTSAALDCSVGQK
jgi:hypothetical protein